MDLRQAQIRFLEKLAHLYDSGVALAEALEIASHDLGDPILGAIDGIVEDLYRGSSLADAMGRRPDVFGPEIVAIVRSGEQRGELGAAARDAAGGLKGRVLDPRPIAAAELETLLAYAGDARVIHLDPGGRVRLRTASGLLDGGELDTAAVGESLARLAGVETEGGAGAFLWNNRLVRVAISPTPEGPSTVVALSAAPGLEPAEARAWRQGRPGLLLVLGDRHADKDACLRSILAAFDPAATKCVAVDLPAPEALDVEDFPAALAQDPDVVCVARLTDPLEPEMIGYAVEEGIYVLVACHGEDLFEEIPHRTLRLG